MKIKHGETDVKISFSFAATVTCMLILDKSGVCAEALFCCFVHEAAHIVCLLICGEKPALVELSFYGIKLERMPVCSRRYDVLVYVSGPAANFILYAVFALCASKVSSAQNLAVISLVTGAFNMLPCRPLDGGNILFEIMRRLMPEEKADKICTAVMWAVLVPLSFFAFFTALKYGNISLGAVTVYLAVLGFFDKREKGTVKL